MYVNEIKLIIQQKYIHVVMDLFSDIKSVKNDLD